MTQIARGRSADTGGTEDPLRRRGRCLCLALGLALGLILGLTPVPAGNAPALAAEAAEAADLKAGDLTITLSALRDDKGNGPCRASVRIETGASLKLATFSMRLALFDPSGAVTRRLTVLAMPVEPDQPTQATFPASPGACASIGAVRLLDFPLCGDANGRRLSCDRAARTDSLIDVPFER